MHVGRYLYIYLVIVKHPMYIGVSNIFLNEMCVRRQCTELELVQQISQ